jgi:hypothetical protein
MSFCSSKILFVCFCLVFCAGCVDVGPEQIGLIDLISINQDGPARGMALSLDENIYVTDFQGSQFLKIAKNNIDASSLSWSKQGIVYTSKLEDIWTINIYSPKYEKTDVLLQELNNVRLPMLKSGGLSYVVLPDEDEFIGSINIYSPDTSKVIILFENAYYDYEWLPGERDIAAITVSNVNEDVFNGSVVIKNIDTLSEKIVFTGVFSIKKDYIDVTKDETLIFSSEDAIYVYNIKEDKLSKWEGPSGYDFRLPPSVDSSLKGYALAKVSGVEDDWKGQLYLVNLKKEIIPVQGWPLWIEEPMLVYLDLPTGDLFSMNLETNETNDITKKYNKEGVR